MAASNLVAKFPSLLIRLAAAHQLPLPGHRREWAEQRALFSYGANFRTAGRETARTVEKILHGAMPADLPVEQVSRLELVINLKTAEALGLTIPPSVLGRADQVIQ